MIHRRLDFEGNLKRNDNVQPKVELSVGTLYKGRGALEERVGFFRLLV